MATRIRVSQPGIAAMGQRLRGVLNTGTNANSTVGRVRGGLGWQITSQQNIDDRLNSVQRRLQRHMELMERYCNFTNTVNSRFEETDRRIRLQAKGVMSNARNVRITSRLPNPPRGGLSGIHLAGIAGIGGLFGIGGLIPSGKTVTLPPSLVNKPIGVSGFVPTPTTGIPGGRLPPKRIADAFDNIPSVGGRFPGLNGSIINMAGSNVRNGEASGFTDMEEKARFMVDSQMNAFRESIVMGESQSNIFRRAWDEAVNVTRENLGNVGTGARRMGNAASSFGNAFVEEVRFGWDNFTDRNNKYIDTVLSFVSYSPCVFGKAAKGLYYFRTGSRIIRGEQCITTLQPTRSDMLAQLLLPPGLQSINSVRRTINKARERHF